MQEFQELLQTFLPFIPAGFLLGFLSALAGYGIQMLIHIFKKI